FVLGLTATPIRRDGQQPIIYMQCGPIRHTSTQPANAPKDLLIMPRRLDTRIDIPINDGIQAIFRHLAQDDARTEAITDDIADAYDAGRKILVLTERTDHLKAIQTALSGKAPPPFMLHGRMSQKQRAELIAELDALAHDQPRILLATGKLVGEGFDHPPLDTLVLAMPVSWKGTLQQYAGRLHREHSDKENVRILDYVDAGHPALLRMWNKRRRGYRAMGYRVDEETQHSDLLS
ncbi:MAG: DNA helicase, partial [Halomonas sp.]|nr:DNA helicase [Halomonas sp.]